MSDQPDPIPRIGRPATPIERGHQLTVENPKLLDELAYNLFASFAKVPVGKTRAAWNALTDEQRDQWRTEIIEASREEIEQQEFDNPGPEGGGPGHPAVTFEEISNIA